MTTSAGAPIGDKLNSQTAGPRGPLLLQDFVFLDEMAHFDRERIPERVVHAKGAGKFLTHLCRRLKVSYCDHSPFVIVVHLSVCLSEPTNGHILGKHELGTCHLFC